MRRTIVGFKTIHPERDQGSNPLLLGNLYSTIDLNQGSTPLEAEIRGGDSRMETTQ